MSIDHEYLIYHKPSDLYFISLCMTFSLCSYIKEAVLLTNPQSWASYQLAHLALGSPPPLAHTSTGLNTRPCPSSPSCPSNTGWPGAFDLQELRRHAMIIWLIISTYIFIYFTNNDIPEGTIYTYVFSLNMLLLRMLLNGYRSIL